MNNSDIKLIAEGLGLFVPEYEGTRCYVSQGTDIWIFNPLESWNDCALIIDSLKDKHLKLTLEFDIWYLNRVLVEILKPDRENADCYTQLAVATGKDFQEAICKAYLDYLSILKGE